MKQWYKNSNLWMMIGEVAVALVSLSLLIIGFALPPTGQIDPSVIQAVGELLGFAVIWGIPSTIRAAKSVKFQKGDLSLEVEKGEDQ